MNQATAAELTRETTNIRDEELGQGLCENSTIRDVKQVYDRLTKEEREYVGRFQDTKPLTSLIAAVWQSLAIGKPNTKGRVKDVNREVYITYEQAVSYRCTPPSDIPEDDLAKYHAFKIVPIPFFQVIDYVRKVTSEFYI